MNKLNNKEEKWQYFRGILILFVVTCHMPGFLI